MDLQSSSPWGNVGAYRGVIGLILMAHLVYSDTCHATYNPEGFNPKYNPPPRTDNTIQYMANFVHAFLKAVQPNPFPKDLILEILKNPENAMSDENLREKVLNYERGFVVCAIFGVVYIVLVPLISVIFAICRCAGKCGGNMYQRQTRKTHCWRRSLLLCTGITTIILFVGNVGLFHSNQSLTEFVSSAPYDLSLIVENIKILATSLPQQMESIADSSFTTVDIVSKNLNDTGPKLGAQIQQRLALVCNPVLDEFTRLDKDLSQVQQLVEDIDSLANSLKTGMNTIDTEITSVKSDMKATLTDASCQNCANAVNLDDITWDPILNVPSIKDVQSSLDEASKADLKAIVQEGKAYLNDIPEIVNKNSKSIVSESQKSLEDTKGEISKIKQQLETFKNLSLPLSNFQTQVDIFLPYVEFAEHVRWGMFLLVSCVILLVALCNTLGLIVGPVGLSPKVDPTKRSCVADCGGTFFMSGAGLSVVFSWFFMFGVVVLFLLGGNLYTLICKPWRTGELLEFIVTPGVIPGLPYTRDLRNMNNFSNIYRDCKKNHSLWTILNLKDHIDLDEYFDMSKYESVVWDQFKNIDFGVSEHELMSSAEKDQVSDIAESSINVNDSNVSEQIEDISKMNLNKTADELIPLATIQPDKDIQWNLRSQAARLGKIQANIEMSILPQLKKLNATIYDLSSNLEKIKKRMPSILESVDVAQAFLNSNTTSIIHAETKTFLACQFNYFYHYAEWAQTMLKQEVGRCQPVIQTLDSAEVIVCANIVDALNAFWFCLGWCLAIFIPSIILCIKLAKYYRKMSTSDSFEENAGVEEQTPGQKSESVTPEWLD